jgi:hypothetical protein
LVYHIDSSHPEGGGWSNTNSFECRTNWWRRTLTYNRSGHSTVIVLDTFSTDSRRFCTVGTGWESGNLYPLSSVSTCAGVNTCLTKGRLLQSCPIPQVWRGPTVIGPKENPVQFRPLLWTTSLGVDVLFPCHWTSLCSCHSHTWYHQHVSKQCPIRSSRTNKKWVSYYFSSVMVTLGILKTPVSLGTGPRSRLSGVPQMSPDRTEVFGGVRQRRDPCW